MDRLNTNLHIMPPEQPAAMPVQDLSAPFHDAKVPGDGACEYRVELWRVLAFSPAMAATLGLAWVIYGWFADMGLSVVDGVLLFLICFNVDANKPRATKWPKWQGLFLKSGMAPLNHQGKWAKMATRFPGKNENKTPSCIDIIAMVGQSEQWH